MDVSPSQVKFSGIITNLVNRIFKVTKLQQSLKIFRKPDKAVKLARHQTLRPLTDVRRI